MVAPLKSSDANRLPSDGPSLSTYLAELLAEQQKLQTPVTRAAVAHDLQPSAWRADRFRELIPLSAPGPGERYAFEVDLDSCSGCKACVSGCHSLNGLDPEETWRDVGVIHAAAASSSSAPFAQTVTTACHHCEDPACLNGCPVLAYEQDPLTGIVRHLDDQCIGCSYCVLKCPYDVPKYNERLGIVRKCDLCHGRLAAGEAPACAQACPTQAIRVVVIPAAPSSAATPAAPDAVVARATLAALSGTDSAYTRPTTRYVSKITLPPSPRAADADTLRPQPAHAPLVALLVLSQLSLGLMTGEILNPKSQILNSAAAALFAAGLAASVFHLGQPLRAWRVFLNLRRSWLSREAVILGLAFPLVVATAALPHLPALLSLSPLPLPPTLTDLVGHFAPLVSAAAIALTAAGVFCSAMLYIDTRRRFWRPAYTFGRMGGTVLVAALAFATPLAAAVVLVAKLALELISVAGHSASARLQRGPLLAPLLGRLLLGALAGLLFALREPALGFVCFALGELMERALYFRAVDSPKMPGLPASGK